MASPATPVDHRPPPSGSDEIIQFCLTGFHRDEKSHRIFARDADRRYRAYRGILDRRSQAAGWTNKLHPPHIFQVIETLVSSLLDPDPKWRLRARPRMDDPSQIDAVRQGAKALQILLNQQLANDGFEEKQRQFGLQALVTGLSVAKSYWRYEEGPAVRQQLVDEPIRDPATGQIIGFQPRPREVRGTEIYHDDPCLEVIDVRDFVWHEAAVSLDRAMRVTHRVWRTFDELKALEAQGVYRNVDQLIESQDQTDGLASRELDLFSANRAKDMIEVLECWIDHGRRVVSIGNRNVLLRDKPNPFWFEHLPNRYPFVVCSATPDLFRIPGISDVEVVQELQEMLWSLQNQRLDNLQLINNAIILMRDDFDDPDSFDFFPGARNLVSDPQAVQMWTPNVNIAQLSLPAENLVKSDLQNIPGASPAVLGQSDPSSQTATEVSLVTTLAQRRLASKKQQFKWAYARAGQQWIALDQQMIRKDRWVQTVGADGEAAWEKISPLLIQGRYTIDVEQLDESLIRQERRAEAQSKLQVAVQAAPVFAATGKPLNLQAFMDDYLEAFGEDDTGRYYTQTPPQGQMPPQQQQQGGMPQPPAQNGGVTNPNLAAGPTSPSNVFSQSPAAFSQQLGATLGGPNNIQR